MKKIISILLALTLLCLPMAVAESGSATNKAAVIGLGNIETSAVELGELEVWAGIEAADAPRFMFSAVAGEDTLAYGLGELADGQIRFMFDGEDKGYVQNLSEIPQANAQMLEGLQKLPELLSQMIPELDNLKVPAIPALPIPKLDASSLLSSFSADGQSFEISTEMVDSVLDLIQTAAGQYANQVPQLQSVLDMLPQLKGQLAVNGAIADEGDAQVTRANILVGGTEAATLVFASKENNVRLGVEADGAEQGALVINSDPGASRMDINVEAMGMSVAGISLFQEDGLQKIGFNVSAGTTASIEFAYGEQDGKDIVSMKLDAGSQGGFECVLNTAMQDDGTREGTLTLTSTMNGNSFDLSADVIMYTAESLDMGEITWPDNMLPFDQMDAQSALQPVVEYLQSVAQEPAA